MSELAKLVHHVASYSLLPVQAMIDAEEWVDSGLLMGGVIAPNYIKMGAFVSQENDAEWSAMVEWTSSDYRHRKLL